MQPTGFNTIAPYFFVRDALSFANFLKNAFDGVETGRTVRDEVIANLRLRIGDSTIMISESNEHFPPMASAYYLYVDDADASQRYGLRRSARRRMRPARQLLVDLTTAGRGRL